MWQSLQVTDIQHNYVSFCAGEKDRCVNLEATMGHDCLWECVYMCVSEHTFVFVIGEQVGPNPEGLQVVTKPMRVHWLIFGLSN